MKDRFEDMSVRDILAAIDRLFYESTDNHKARMNFALELTKELKIRLKETGI